MRFSANLKVTLVLAVVAFGGLLFLAFAAVSSYWVTHDLSEQFHRRGEFLSDNLASEAAQSLSIADDFERGIRLLLLTRRATIGDVAYAQVVRGGEVVSESIQPDDLELEVIPKSSLRPSVRHLEHQSMQYLDFVRPLPGGEPGSYARLGLSLESVRQRSKQIVRMIGGLSVLFTGLGVVGAFGLYSIIFKPLDRLMASIRQVSQGAFPANTDIRGCREFEEISAAFNHMAREINRRTEDLHQRNAELQQANRAKTEFLTMVGHELKTPLHSIRGYCQLLLEEADGPISKGQRADLQSMLAAGNHLLSLIQNILRFIESGTDGLHLAPVSLRLLLHHRLTTYARWRMRKRLPCGHRRRTSPRRYRRDQDQASADQSVAQRRQVHAARGTCGSPPGWQRKGCMSKCKTPVRGSPSKSRNASLNRSSASRGERHTKPGEWA